MVKKPRGVEGRVRVEGQAHRTFIQENEVQVLLQTKSRQTFPKPKHVTFVPKLAADKGHLAHIVMMPWALTKLGLCDKSGSLREASRD